MAVDKAKIKEVIEHLQKANQLQQTAGLPVDEDDLSYELHNAIENIIEVLEEHL